MPENKDQLLQQQYDEIQKLKKELKEASRPSSLFSTLKKSIRRSIHEFFNREDRMKSMDAEIRELKKKLEETEESNREKDAILFAAASGELKDAPEPGAEPAGQNSGFPCDLPQTPEEALKRYFGPCDIVALVNSMDGKENSRNREAQKDASAPDRGTGAAAGQDGGARTGAPDGPSAIPAATEHAAGSRPEGSSVSGVSAAGKPGVAEVTEAAGTVPEEPLQSAATQEKPENQEGSPESRPAVSAPEPSSSGDTPAAGQPEPASALNRQSADADQVPVSGKEPDAAVPGKSGKQEPAAPGISENRDPSAFPAGQAVEKKKQENLPSESHASGNQGLPYKGQRSNIRQPDDKKKNRRKKKPEKPQVPESAAPDTERQENRESAPAFAGRTARGTDREGKAAQAAGSQGHPDQGAGEAPASERPSADAGSGGPQKERKNGRDRESGTGRDKIPQTGEAVQETASTAASEPAPVCAGDETETDVQPGIYMGFAEESGIVLPPVEPAGSVFDEDNFDDDLL